MYVHQKAGLRWRSKRDQIRSSPWKMTGEWTQIGLIVPMAPFAMAMEAYHFLAILPPLYPLLAG